MSDTKEFKQNHIDRGDTIDGGAAPAEFRAISVTKSEVSDDRYGVVSYSRNYLMTRNVAGEIVDNGSPAFLSLKLVE